MTSKPRAKTITNERFIEIWNQSASISEVAMKCGRSRETVRTLARQLRRKGFELKQIQSPYNRRKAGPVYEPTQAEIKAACEEIRSKRSATELNSRLRPDWRSQRVEFEESKFLNPYPERRFLKSSEY